MKKYMLPALLSCCFVSGFSNAKTENVVADSAISAISQKPWLREYLADDTLIYARVPSIWSLFSYKDDSFKYALGNAEFTRVMKQLQSASPSLIETADAQLQPWLNLLIAQINGPIELAVVPGAAVPQMILSASVKLTAESELQSLINALKKQGIVMGETAPMNSGAGLLKASVGNVPYRWDQDNNRLNFLVNLGGASLAQLDAKLAALTPNSNSPMLANEKQMDTSQQGLYLWVNNTLAYPLYQPLLLSQDQTLLQLLAVEEIKSVALSVGVRDQKGRVKLQIESPTTGMLRSVIPTNNNTFNVDTAGEPKVAALLAIPSQQQFSVIESTLSAAGQAEGQKEDKYQVFKQGFKKTLGFELGDIFSAIGSELIAVSDSVGEYALVKIRDEQKLLSILEQLKQQPEVNIVSQSVAGVDINHLKFPSLSYLSAVEQAGEKEQLIDKIFNNTMTHVYYQFDGEFLVLASLPQILVDRQLNTDKVNLGQWYKETQRQDVSGSTLAISGSVEQAPRRIYYSYLQGMQYLADMLQVEIDPFSLPSAKQLSLASKGSLGLQIDSTPESVSLEMSFESTPADVLLAAPVMGAVSVAGIVSAIAIPAYQDYIFRAKLASVSLATRRLKDKIAQSYQQQGTFPDKIQRDELLQRLIPSADYRVDIVVGAGDIITTFDNKPGKFIKWTPSKNEQGIEWQCFSNLATSQKPMDCR